MYDHGAFRVIHEEPVHSADGSRIGRVAASFVREGLIPVDSAIRTLAPSQCLRSALEDSSLMVYFVPAINMNHIRDIERQIAGMKRRASDDLMAQSRPRKIQVTGEAPSQFLVATDGAF